MERSFWLVETDDQGRVTQAYGPYPLKEAIEYWQASARQPGELLQIWDVRPVVGERPQVRG
jgi:hypothetical protein